MSLQQVPRPRPLRREIVSGGQVTRLEDFAVSPIRTRHEHILLFA
jgi:hypothetical protein